jgi:cell division protein FtsL
MPKPSPKRATAPKTRKRQVADKAQFERFVETAKKIGMDEDPEALDRAFDKIAPSKSPLG